jgi:hypothetical protein
MNYVVLNFLNYLLILFDIHFSKILNYFILFKILFKSIRSFLYYNIFIFLKILSFNSMHLAMLYYFNIFIFLFMKSMKKKIREYILLIKRSYLSIQVRLAS